MTNAREEDQRYRPAGVNFQQDGAPPHYALSATQFHDLQGWKAFDATLCIRFLETSGR